MKDIYTAIMTSFNALTGGAHNSFWEDIQGRLYKKGSVPQNSDFPYAVFMIVVGTPDWTFTGSSRDIVLQLSLFSKAQNSNSTELEDMYDHQKAIFDNKPLSYSGSTLAWMLETNLVDLTEGDEITLPDGSSGVRWWAVDYELKDY